MVRPVAVMPTGIYVDYNDATLALVQENWSPKKTVMELNSPTGWNPRSRLEIVTY